MGAAYQACDNTEGHGPESDDDNGDQSNVSEEIPSKSRSTENAAEEQQSTNLDKPQSVRREEVKDNI